MLSIGAFNALVENVGRTAGVCYIYSCDNGGTQDSDYDLEPMPAI